MDEIALSTSFDDFVVRRALIRDGRPPAPALDAARRLVFDLRLRLERGEPLALELAERLAALTGEVPTLRAPDASLEFVAFSRQLLSAVENALLDGRLLVARRPTTSLTDRREISLPELPPLPRPRPETGTQTFEVRFLDEIGKAISGIDAEFDADGAQTRATNAAGIALLEGVEATSARVAVFDAEALTKALEPRWENFRPGAPPKESNTKEVVFDGSELGPFPIKAAVPNTIVVKPPLGKLFVELFDKTGRVRHANRTFQITGPQAFEGTTDADGRLLQTSVFPGDYQLSLALDFFEENDPDRAVDIVDSPIVTLEPTDARPQVRLLGAVPRSVLARLQLFFNTNKTFLLPTALPSVFKLRQLYEQNAPCQLLVVGHADTRGGAAYNDKLSLERAQATIAYLKDDVETWFQFYSDAEPKKRWGRVEDRLMITAMPGFVDKPRDEDAVRWFQRTRHLKVDGDAGKATRHALIEEYMSLDGASLADFVGEIVATAHGCGENFPLDDTGQQLDSAPADEKRDRLDRRVEVYFFDPEFGITPPPPGPNSKPGSVEYPLWRKRVVAEIDLEREPGEGAQVTFVELVDALFRTNSAVVLPEGSAPSNSSGDPTSASAASIFGTALRFNQTNPGKHLFVAGHTDTTATEGFNQKLSEERARSALALLLGGDEQRKKFQDICDKRHKVADYKQILKFVAGTFAFDCDPGPIDDKAETGAAAVGRFQTAYNANKGKLGASASNLSVDGVVGPLTWGAFFDCYEAALRRELGEDANGIKALRDALVFVDAERKALGFGEHFPVEELGVDNFKSQSNRRVELLFFDPGEAPDLAADEADPETSEAYLPGHFARTSVEVPTVRRTLRAFLFDDRRQRMPNTPYRLSTGLQFRAGTTDETGFLEQEGLLVPRSALIEWGVPLDLPPVPFEERPENPPLEWTRKPTAAPLATKKFRFQRQLLLELREGPGGNVDAEAARRLTNLGYVEATLQQNVAAFQRDYEIANPEPWFHAPTRDRLFDVHRDGIEMDIAPKQDLVLDFGLDEDGSPPAFEPGEDA